MGAKARWHLRLVKWHNTMKHRSTAHSYEISVKWPLMEKRNEIYAHLTAKKQPTFLRHFPKLFPTTANRANAGLSPPGGFLPQSWPLFHTKPKPDKEQIKALSIFQFSFFTFRRTNPIRSFTENVKSLSLSLFPANRFSFLFFSPCCSRKSQFVRLNFPHHSTRFEGRYFFLDWLKNVGKQHILRNKLKLLINILKLKENKKIFFWRTKTLH